MAHGDPCADNPGLVPTFAGIQEGTKAGEQVAAIDESNRMTLKFRKP